MLVTGMQRGRFMFLASPAHRSSWFTSRYAIRAQAAESRARPVFPRSGRKSVLDAAALLRRPRSTTYQLMAQIEKVGS